MRPEDVPAWLVRAAMAARWDLAYPDTACRSILAAVLPLHEQQVRERAETAERELAELRERRPLPGPTYDAGWADALRAVRMPGLHEREAAWRKFREAVGDATPQQPEPEPCDGDCDCDCQPGQPCLCPERDCYCGPCRVCGPTPQQPEGGDRG